MAVFKCKMCGASLDIVEGSTVCQCEYCMTKQTLPKLTDEKRANLYDRANHFRRNNEFDKAMSIYENILNEDSTDAEAYWSLILCNYGIEYVEDPATKRRLPTVNRTQYTSIFDDENYKSAIANADFAQKSIYESEAKAINEIQKGILAISQKEKPFDVFICYKETDANGRRTPDSVLAQELYYGLKNEGFNVFFSRITLEDKLGSAYEPYIFAALNSAKVMVVLGTRQEHFNAVWVKNEWSRYLSLIKQGEKKTLIPAYRDMDPYDLPEEFSHLQAQDMSKLGFMQDLIRGIKKIVSKDEPKTSTVVKETVVQSASTNVAPLLKRAFIFLEDEDWKSAEEYCEKVLDQDPENAQAYLGKLMVELKVKKQDDLKNCSEPFDNNLNYRKVMRYGDGDLKKLLQDDIDYIKARNEKARQEQEKLKREAEEKARREQERLKLQQEEERKKAEELRRQQEEERKKAEEERNRKEAEEKEKCEALWAEYISALEYEKECEKKRRTINENIEILTNQVNKLIIIKNNWDSIETKIIQLIEKEKNLNDKISQLNIELNSLGFFAIKRKKEIPVIIQDYERQRNSTRREIENVSKEKQGYQSFVDVCNAIETTQAKINGEKNKLNDLLKMQNSATIRAELAQYEYGKFLTGYVLDNNGYVKFGSYPKTKVADSSLINILNSKAGMLPTSSNSYAWNSYKYYIAGNASDFMWYIDVVQGGVKYRGVYFTSYRPDDTARSSSTDNTYQDDNGYTTSTVYWFKYEPISWTILSENTTDGTALILCDMIIDSQEYYITYGVMRTIDGKIVSPNNYAHSTIRKWLNETFYNTAFSELQKQIILTTTVDNSAASRGYSSINYVCENTEDKIFLLSEQEVTNTAYGFASSTSTNDTARRKKTTDYAQAQGADTMTSTDYAGNGGWWLRSPAYESFGSAHEVNSFGNVSSYIGYVNSVDRGVVPALQIRL